MKNPLFGLLVTPVPLTLYAITPSSGPDGGSFTLKGTGFLDATDVAANGFTLGSWTIVDDKTITATHDPEGPTPPYTARILVTNSRGAVVGIDYGVTS